MFTLGDCFMLPRPGCTVEHLYVLITQPDAMQRALMVNITTRRAFSDLTTILRPGDHPFISHESVVYYIDAREVEVKHLLEAERLRTLRRHAPCPLPMLSALQSGVLASPLTPRKIKAAFVLAVSEGRT